MLMKRSKGHEIKTGKSPIKYGHKHQILKFASCISSRIYILKLGNVLKEHTGSSVAHEDFCHDHGELEPRGG